MYDSLSDAPANFLLPLRSSAGLNQTRPLPLPGNPGRWQMPPAASALPDVADMYSTIDNMYNTYVSGPRHATPFSTIGPVGHQSWRSVL